jgi:hypothetical protein
MSTGHRHVFARWQPAYAVHRIATFPVRIDKVPAIRGYQKIGLRGSGQLAEKFASMPALGFMCGPRSNVTVLDVDTSNEQVLGNALARHGTTPILIRTASGKWHAWYRHNGERRQIRPWPGLPIDILGGGFVIAPPSRTARGRYQFVDGSLEDLNRLPIMRVDKSEETASAVRDSGDIANPLRGMREHDGRNKALFLTIAPVAKQIYAAGETRDALLDVSLSHNRECIEPMSIQEVTKIVDSVWRMTCEGRNWVGQRDRRERELSTFSDHPDAFFLLELLRVNEGASVRFWIANGLADRLGWTIRRFVNARNRLVELGYVKQIGRPWQGKPALYVWP